MENEDIEFTVEIRLGGFVEHKKSEKYENIKSIDILKIIKNYEVKNVPMIERCISELLEKKINKK